MQGQSRAATYKMTNTKKPLGNGNFLWMLLTLCVLIIFGVFICASMVPNEYSNGPSTNSIITKVDSSVPSLRSKLLAWLPNNHENLINPIIEEPEEQPDWSMTFWTPIDVDVSSDPMITLCKLNFMEYSKSPHLYAMFRDLETKSQCMGLNRKREKLSVLMKEINDKKDTLEGRVIKPSGFVFHESRVGSTLVANTLASDPWSMVFSESAPAANALLHCTSCTRERNIEIFRDVVTLMGRSPFHKHMFLKFQSITTTKMDIALEAFPDTPWAFVYRQPVQTMMSHLDPLKSSSQAPCLRSMRSPPDEVKSTIASVMGSGSGSPPKEAWCAAHLNMLCSNAMRNFDKYGKFPDFEGQKRQRGMLINYEALPGIIPQVVLPMFGIFPAKSWLKKMEEESKNYSKGRSGTRVFAGDSQDKDSRATDNIQKYARSILQPTYDKMMKMTEESVQATAPELFALLQASDSSSTGTDKWGALKTVPKVLAPESIAAWRKSGHSVVDKMSRFHIEEIEKSAAHKGLSKHPLAHNMGSGHSYFDPVQYVPWAPFSNTHDSKPIERVSCPMTPEPDYPKTYPMLDIVNNWNTDVTDIPPVHYDSLCHFDFFNETELAAAYKYRDAERPFLMYNIPEVDDVVKKWSDVDYLHKKMGKKPYRVETSKTNHFMYWRSGGGAFLRGTDGKKWSPPTGTAQQTFEDWLELAVKGQNKTLEDRTHQYFRASSDNSGSWVYDELPFFKPVKSLMMVNPREQRGIHCRFGMRSVIAEAHFDGSRNAVVMLGGLRRWIMTHPNQCSDMHMYPNGHPSGRHSAVDWSKPDVVKFPNFPKVKGNEVILQPGDFLYVPTYWIHYIVSLNVNYQCNSRSGKSNDFDLDLKKCGF